MATRRRFDEELNGLRQDLLVMGFRCEEMLRDATRAFAVGQDNEQDDTLAESVIEADEIIDTLEVDIERRCLLLVTLQQPVVASDLRLLFTALKCTTDIERIGDHCVNIAKAAIRMRSEGVLYRPLVDLPLLTSRSASMLHEALEAFVHRDPSRARAVMEADAELDRLYARSRRILFATMRGDPASAELASYLQFVAHYLERIGDHCVNVAERVCFLETGQVERSSSAEY